VSGSSSPSSAWIAQLVTQHGLLLVAREVVADAAIDVALDLELVAAAREQLDHFAQAHARVELLQERHAIADLEVDEVGDEITDTLGIARVDRLLDGVLPLLTGATGRHERLVSLDQLAQHLRERGEHGRIRQGDATRLRTAAGFDSATGLDTVIADEIAAIDTLEPVEHHALEPAHDHRHASGQPAQHLHDARGRGDRVEIGEPGLVVHRIALDGRDHEALWPDPTAVGRRAPNRLDRRGTPEIDGHRDTRKQHRAAQR
jgi:hypothetical protein